MSNSTDRAPIHWVLAPDMPTPAHDTALHLAVAIRLGDLDPSAPLEWSYDIGFRYAAPTPEDLAAGFDVLARDPRGLLWFADDLIERSRTVEAGRTT